MVGFDYSALGIVFLGAVTRSAIFFLVAAGLTLVFGVLNVINFAHGSIYMLGAFVCYAIVSRLAGNAYAFWIALALAPLVTAAAGGLIEYFLLRRVYKREHVAQLLVTFALILVIDDISRFFWGGYAETGTSKPESLAGRISVFGHDFPAYYIFIIILTAVVVALLWLILYKTRWGKLIRATAADAEMATALGVNAPVVFTIVFMIGAWLAGLGGAIYAPMGQVSLGIDLDMVIICFIVIIVGGVGNIWGALVAALIIGMVDGIGTLVLPQYSLIFIYLIMIIVLVVRPQGLLGKAGR